MQNILFLADQGAAAPASNMSFQLIIMGLLFAGMYFLIIAPNRKRQKQHSQMLAALTTGDEIVTNGGLFGSITNVKEDRFVVKIADSTKVEISKSSVQSKVAEQTS